MNVNFHAINFFSIFRNSNSKICHRMIKLHVLSRRWVWITLAYGIGCCICASILSLFYRHYFIFGACKTVLSSTEFQPSDSRFSTKAIHSGHKPTQWSSMEVVPPISLSTTYEQYGPGEPKVIINYIYNYYI